MTGEGGYLDEDHGNWVLYSGTDSTKDGTVSADTQLLLDSHASGKSVRFIRSHKLGKLNKDGVAKSAWAPSHGYRYDGLYKVTNVEKLGDDENPRATKHRFKMVRLPEQDPIRGGNAVGARPTAEEIKTYQDDKRFR